jgi:ATP-dependent RNA helicase RhlE
MVRNNNRNHNYRGHNNRSGRKQKQMDVDLTLLVKKAVAPINEEVYQPQHTFSDFALHPQLKQNIISHGYVTPTPIQDQAIPHLLEGRDVVGIANTGTGKTAAFLLPLITKIMQNRSENVLIVTPTRELAVQIQDEAIVFTNGMGIGSVLCIGGVSMYHQIQGLRRRPNIVIGTPGRLKDLQKQGCLYFGSYRTIVLDEVDRMLDMGFINDVRHMISLLPQQRQSLFFSATLSPAIRDVMHTFLRNPVTVSVKSQETAANVEQDVIRTNGRDKLDILHDLLVSEGVEKAIVFGRTKYGVEKIARQLDRRGFRVAALHGNKSQNQRQRALDQFKQNRINVLLATDVAARGLDIPNVTHVINFDLPATYDDYVHRIGRTGRANKKGIALSFID